MKEPTSTQIVQHLQRANQVAQAAVSQGHHPFGAILVAPDHTTVLLEQGNMDTVNHAELTLMRRAYAEFEPNFLWGCTLYTTVEPCVMCAGAQYWANVGRLVYGIAEKHLLALTGNHVENPTLDVPCRYVFERGQKAIAVWGPIAEVEAEIVALHRGFWNQ
ncbi:nucleoside deaminase [Leptolyngbya subtilissima ST-M1]|uniref:nucleoside deaminase n=1 Tax=Cyanophyceae TaxID=3028117 RepID=UPI00325FC3E4